MGEKKYTVASVGPRIQEFLQKTLNAAGLKVRWEIVDAENAEPDLINPDLIVKFGGADVDLLLANKGEVLLALEHLTMEALRMPPDDHTLLCFDANDYRLLRIEELRLSALTAAEKVKKTKVPFHFNPMTSRERRIIHVALRNEPAVRSESTGIGPHRQVVIYPAGMPSKPAPASAASPPFRRGRRP